MIVITFIRSPRVTAGECPSNWLPILVRGTDHEHGPYSRKRKCTSQDCTLDGMPIHPRVYTLTNILKVSSMHFKNDFIMLYKLFQAILKARDPPSPQGLCTFPKALWFSPMASVYFSDFSHILHFSIILLIFETGRAGICLSADVFRSLLFLNKLIL